MMVNIMIYHCIETRANSLRQAFCPIGVALHFVQDQGRIQDFWKGCLITIFTTGGDTGWGDPPLVMARGSGGARAVFCIYLA